MTVLLRSLAGPIARYATAGSIRVLMYHRFSATPEPRRLHAAAFREHLEYIRRHFTPVRLSTLVETCRAGGELPPRAVAVTVDDGYRDFVEVAYPLLREYQIPATLFVISDVVHDRDWAWYDKLRFSCFGTQVAKASFELNGNVFRLSLDSALARENAWDLVATHGVDLSPSGQRELVSAVAEALAVNVPATAPTGFAGADGDSLRALDESLVELGGHSSSHPILAHCSDTELEREIVGSTRELQSTLQRHLRVFCYPNGMAADYDARCVSAVERAGYIGACVAHGGACAAKDLHARPFQVPRISAGGVLSTIRAQLDGAAYLRARLARAVSPA